MWIALLTIVLSAASLHLAPFLAGRQIFFGITVSRAFRDGSEARVIARRYAAEIWILAIAAAVFAISSPTPAVSGPMLLAQSVGASVAFLGARARVRPHATAPPTIREAGIGPRERLPGGLLGQLGPFLVLLAAGAYAALNWEHIPERFPTHWNLAGTPNGWTTKSVGGVFRGLAIGFVACGLLWFTSYAVLQWTRLPRVSGPEGARDRRVRRVNLLAMLASAYTMACLLAWTTGVTMFAPDPRGRRLPLVIRVLPLALLFASNVAVRIVRSTSSRGELAGDSTPDACWLFGRIYCNRADPTLFVERRVGLGYTLNLGNPWSWLVMTTFVGALGGVAFFVV